MLARGTYEFHTGSMTLFTGKVFISTPEDTGHFRASVFPKMSKSGIKWDEGNLAENEEERLTANRTKIDEPKTPFHRLEEDGEEPMAYPPKAPPAKAGGPLRPSEDLFAKIAQAAEERQANAETPEDEEGASPSPGHAHTLVCVRKHSSARCAWRVFAEKRAAFEHGRKNHYKIGSLAELRKKAAEMDAEEEED